MSFFCENKQFFAKFYRKGNKKDIVKQIHRFRIRENMSRTCYICSFSRTLTYKCDDLIALDVI